MMWKQLSSDIDRQTDLLYVIRNPDFAFKKNFKFFFEERLWRLAQIQFDPKAFNLMNFNQIVKVNLLKNILAKGVINPAMKQPVYAIDAESKNSNSGALGEKDS